jgi:hypothetical protein
MDYASDSKSIAMLKHDGLAGGDSLDGGAPPRSSFERAVRSPFIKWGCIGFLIILCIAVGGIFVIT